MSEAKIEAFLYNCSIEPTELYCQLFHIIPELRAIMLRIVFYLPRALVLRGFKSLFLIYENINSIGASLN
jgi:hypothetical protein